MAMILARARSFLVKWVSLTVDERREHRPEGDAHETRARSESLIPVDSRNFSSRWTSRMRSCSARVRARVKSRSLRIGSGGMNEASSSLWAPN